MNKNKILLSIIIILMCNVLYAKNAAVVPFAAGNNVRSDIADMLTNSFTSEIQNITSYSVTDAETLDAALSDIRIDNPNTIDKTKAIEIGEKTSSQIIITGTVQTNSDTKNPYKLVIKCFDLEVGKSLMKTAYIPLTKRAENNPAMAEDIYRDVSDGIIDQIMSNAVYASAEERQREREQEQKEQAKAAAEAKKAEAEAKKDAKKAEKEDPKEHRFRKRTIEGKWEIDVSDRDAMLEKYKQCRNIGIGTAIGGSIAVVTGIGLVAGGTVIAVFQRSGNDVFIGTGITVAGGTLGLYGAIPLFIVCGQGFTKAKRIANIYHKETGEQLVSFLQRTSIGGGYDWDNKEVTVAMAIKL